VEGALASSAAAAALTIELSTILAYEIDFLTEPRAGDRIRLLVEEKWLDEEFLGFGRIIYAAYEGARVCVQGVCFGTDSAGSAAGIYYTPEGESLTRAFLRSPLNYRRISSRFSRRRFHPILRVWRPHLGVDYAAASGTPVVATGGGVVGFAGWNGGFGNQVRIRHGSLYETCYGHLSRFARGLRAGQRVERGQLIGYVGSTGLSTGPHLDFRVKERGTYVDPLSMRNPREEAVPASLQEAFQSHCLRLGCLIDSLAAGAAVVYAPAEPRGGPLTGGEGQHAWRGGSARFRQL
jgi:murein DD-endopeptidase MepM/ murein hydrolase activator NlpD